MTKLQVVTTLDSKRKQILAYIARLEADMVRARRDLSAVTEAIRIFTPQGECASAYMHFAGLFGRRELPELCRQAFDAADGPLDTSEIATYAMLAKGMDATDKHLRKAVTYKIVMILRRWERLGRLKRLGKRGTVLVWRSTGTDRL